MTHKLNLFANVEIDLINLCSRNQIENL